MPIHNININEYKCGHCGYRWINRINAKDGPVPKCCAKCKRTNWNDPTERISPYEIGLRRKIREFFKLYDLEYDYFNKDRVMITWPIDLSAKFLEIKPRPTIKELKKVIYPFGYDLRKRRFRDMTPDPDRPGDFLGIPHLKYSSSYMQDPQRPDTLIWNKDNEFDKLKLKEMERRQELMIQIMKSRDVDYDPEIRLKIQREKRLEKYNEFRKKVDNEPLRDDSIPDYFLKSVGDGICYKCKRRRSIVPNDNNVQVCHKCGTLVSDKWTGIVMKIVTRST
ncbi:MAG: hypothetical protein WA941_12565 [Nitrososphaeraceae archaeon]